MATYVILYTYTTEGAKNIRDSIKRAGRIRQQNARVGFTVKDVYWTQGSYDMVAIVDAPSEEAMMGAMMNVVAPATSQASPCAPSTRSRCPACWRRRCRCPTRKRPRRGSHGAEARRGSRRACRRVHSASTAFAQVRRAPMQVPETRYARVGDLRIAYQKWGDGPPLLIIPDLISNIEIIWEHEALPPLPRAPRPAHDVRLLRQARHRPVGSLRRRADTRAAERRHPRRDGRGGLGARAHPRHVGGRGRWRSSSPPTPGSHREPDADQHVRLPALHGSDSASYIRDRATRWITEARRSIEHFHAHGRNVGRGRRLPGRVGNAEPDRQRVLHTLGRRDCNASPLARRTSRVSSLSIIGSRRGRRPRAHRCSHAW